MVLAIAVISNLGQYYTNRSIDNSGPFFGGMSGVVYGLFGYVWMKSRYDPGAGFYMHPNLVFWMLVFFIVCLAGFIPNVANAAHGFGLAVGIVLGYAPIALRR
jgi:GlpG protein